MDSSLASLDPGLRAQRTKAYLRFNPFAACPGLVPKKWRRSDDDLKEVAKFLLESEKDLASDLDQLSEFAESPIELMLGYFLLALFLPIHTRSPILNCIRPRLSLSYCKEFVEREEEAAEFAHLIPQAYVPNIGRLDFLVRVKVSHQPSVLSIAIECDGHDFHQKTKEQAAKDAKRDRALTCAGVRVLRFTGSQIARSPVMCGDEVGYIIREYARPPDASRLKFRAPAAESFAT